MSNITTTDVRCQKGDSAFLIDDGKTSILYDTGFGFTGFDVAENIKKVLGERCLDYIFLTHSHYDHALGSAYILRHYPEAKVVAGEYARDIFKRDGAKKVMKRLDLAFAKKCGMADYEFLGDELRVDIPVCDGDIICAGDFRFEVIHLPGHTKCSVGFYSEKLKLFLSTETLGVYDGDKTIVPSFLSGYNDTLKSIDRMKNYSIKQIVSPHFGLLGEDRTKFFLDNMKGASERYAEDILKKLNEGKSDDVIIREITNRFLHGYIKEIYPEDAAILNTSIMIELIRKELLSK